MVRYYLKLLVQDRYLRVITLATLAVYLTICMIVSATDQQGSVVSEVFTNRYYWFFCFFSVDLSATYILAKRESVILALRAGCMKCELVYQVATLNIFMLVVLGVHLAITVLIPPLMGAQEATGTDLLQLMQQTLYLQVGLFVVNSIFLYIAKCHSLLTFLLAVTTAYFIFLYCLNRPTPGWLKLFYLGGYLFWSDAKAMELQAAYCKMQIAAMILLWSRKMWYAEKQK